jgi:hypothetical protein
MTMSFPPALGQSLSVIPDFDPDLGALTPQLQTGFSGFGVALNVG